MRKASTCDIINALKITYHLISENALQKVTITVQRLFSYVALRRVHCHMQNGHAAFRNPLNLRVVLA